MEFAGLNFWSLPLCRLLVVEEWSRPEAGRAGRAGRAVRWGCGWDSGGGVMRGEGIQKEDTLVADEMRTCERYGRKRHGDVQIWRKKHFESALHG